ncbi:hypothetical protein SLE2022_169820 [Rubroshorea leprosula]
MFFGIVAGFFGFDVASGNVLCITRIVCMALEGCRVVPSVVPRTPSGTFVSIGAAASRHAAANRNVLCIARIVGGDLGGSPPPLVVPRTSSYTFVGSATAASGHDVACDNVADNAHTDGEDRPPPGILAPSFFAHIAAGIPPGAYAPVPLGIAAGNARTPSVDPRDYSQ